MPSVAAAVGWRIGGDGDDGDGGGILVNRWKREMIASNLGWEKKRFHDRLIFNQRSRSPFNQMIRVAMENDWMSRASENKLESTELVAKQYLVCSTLRHPHGRTYTHTNSLIFHSKLCTWNCHRIEHQAKEQKRLTTPIRYTNQATQMYISPIIIYACHQVYCRKLYSSM